MAVAELEVDVSGFGVDGGSADAVAAVDDVAEVVAEAGFPEFFAGDGIEAEERFLDVLAFIAVEAEGVEFAVGDDGGSGALDVV